jgi:hypothetical protein
MLKIHSLLILISTSLLLSSCSESAEPSHVEEPSTQTLEPNPTHGFRTIDLSEHELNINLYIPEKFYDDEDGLPRFVPTNVKHNLGEARWEITLTGDKRWHLVIEELGADTSGVSAEMERLKEVDFFAYNFEIISDSTLVFNRYLKAEKTTLDTTNLVQNANYQFYCNRVINGYNLVFKNYELKDFRKLTINKMLTSALYSY